MDIVGGKVFEPHGQEFREVLQSEMNEMIPK
jgi:hypothetical protein